MERFIFSIPRFHLNTQLCPAFPFCLKLFEEADVVLIEETQIVDVITAHYHALKSHAESESAVLFRINAAVLQYLRVNHAAAKDFDPAFSLAETAALAMTVEALYIDLCAGLREGK